MSQHQLKRHKPEPPRASYTPAHIKQECADVLQEALIAAGCPTPVVVFGTETPVGVLLTIDQYNIMRAMMDFVKEENVGADIDGTAVYSDDDDLTLEDLKKIKPHYQPA